MKPYFVMGGIQGHECPCSLSSKNKVSEFSAEPTRKIIDGELDGQKELAEEGVFGADFVEAHFVD